MLVAMVVLCAAGAQASVRSASVAGVVRDSRGTPQIDATVELLSPGLKLLGRTQTDDRGRYHFGAVTPGVYEVKASADLFLPTLRENLHILNGSRMVVNLTLETLYEAFRWLPAQPRKPNEPKDDWSWTLRLAANRPLLRMLQNGPLVMVTDGDGSSPELKARVTVSGGEGGFGEGGVHDNVEMMRTPDDMRAMIFRADLTQAANPALNAMVGYEQQLAPGHTFRSIAAVEDMPQIMGGPGIQGMQAIAMRTGETLHLMPGIQAEVGDEAEAIRLGEMLMANQPFAALMVQSGSTDFAYRMTSAPGIQGVDDLDRPATEMPQLAERNGRPVLEQGLHQEVSVTRSMGNVRVKVTAWHEHVENPVLTGGGHVAEADWSGGNVLYDPASGLLRVAGSGFTGNGMMSEVEGRVDGNTWVSFDVAVGEAMGLSDAAAGSETLSEALQNMTAHETPVVRAAVQGRVRSAGTRWQASYRWQDPNTLTPVDSFAMADQGAFLSLMVRQPIRIRRMLPNGVEALVNVQNLLAEGYRPFVSRDGSTLYFAQNARCIEGGLSFTF
jgi:hypothetical protein